MLRIGVDFDNTIACYDRAFSDVASLMGFVSPQQHSSKSAIKESILRRPGGDVDWQRLQGQVYGKHMLRAEAFPGFYEFLYLCKLRGYEVFIVSHKSEFGHFDEDRVPLREQAIHWMQNNGIFAENGLALSRDQVFFESTREDKIRRIQILECTHFIDDLREVFEEPSFPSSTKKILFQSSGVSASSPSVHVSDSWRDIAQELHGGWQDDEISQVVRTVFPELGVKQAKLIKGRGNSRIYALTDGGANNYALKVYPDRQRDSRPRLDTEFSACKELKSSGYRVTEPVVADSKLGWGIFKWVSGGATSSFDGAFLADATEFVRQLFCDTQLIGTKVQFPLASEACLSGSDLTAQIEQRLQRLLVVESDVLSDYVNRDFLPCFLEATQRAKIRCGKDFHMPISKKIQMLSPSDFGSHNALRTDDGEIVYIDFEYFGWDDPVKLVSDFYWHPGMSLTSASREKWIHNAREIFECDETFDQRLDAYLPLFGLKWCLILLNEYLKHGAAQRLHADPMKAADLGEIRREQLKKSKALLQEIKELIHVYGSAIEAS